MGDIRINIPMTLPLFILGAAEPPPGRGPLARALSEKKRLNESG